MSEFYHYEPVIYKSIDTLLDEWAKSHGLEWQKDFKDFEVRVMHIDNCHLRVGNPSDKGIDVVVTYEHKTGSKRFHATEDTLYEVLEEAYEYIAQL